MLAESRHKGCDRMKEEEIHYDICVPATQPTDETSDMIAITYTIEVKISFFRWKTIF